MAFGNLTFAPAAITPLEEVFDSRREDDDCYELRHVQHVHHHAHRLSLVGSPWEPSISPRGPKPGGQGTVRSRFDLSALRRALLSR